MIQTQTPAIDKAVQIFDFLSNNGASTFSEIYQGIGLPKSTTSSLLAALTAHGLLKQEQNKFYLGMKLYELGNKVLDALDIKKLALAPLKRLRDETELTCHLGILEDNCAVYLIKLESPSPVIVRSWVGKKLSLHSSGLGKVLLAWRSEEQVDQLLPKKTFKKFTESTITDKVSLKKELAKIKEQGWAFDNEEDCLGVYCISAPIFDKDKKVVAAISASGVSFQVTPEKIPQFVQSICSVAQEISEKIC